MLLREIIVAEGRSPFRCPSASREVGWHSDGTFALRVSRPVFES